MAQPELHIYLIPGFFGFANIGALRYFEHVRAALESRAKALGRSVRIHDVETLPTASIARRAARVLDTIAATAGWDDAPIALVGHSTGGIDARLLLQPGVELPSTHDPALFTDRITHILGITSPHQGSPLATAFNAYRGAQLLRLLSTSLVGLMRRGALDSDAVQSFAGWIDRKGDERSAPMLFDRVVRELLDREGREQRRALEAFFADVAEDGTLLVQLQPESMDIFNAAMTMPERVRCGSIVAAARPPTRDLRKGFGLNPKKHTSVTIFSQLYRFTAVEPGLPWKPLEQPHATALDAADPIFREAGANDGMVPVRSQLWGEVVSTVVADHMDVLGHFHAPNAERVHHEWVASGTGFSLDDFAELWRIGGDWLLA